MEDAKNGIISNKCCWISLSDARQRNQVEGSVSTADLLRHAFRLVADLCDDAPLVLALTPCDVQLLRRDSVVADMLGVDVHPDRVKELTCYGAIQAYLVTHPSVFAKVAEASPKEHLEPLATPEAIWRALATSRRVRTFLINLPHELGADLVLRPWNADITVDNEFRVFVRDGQCVGVSQQNCWQPVHVVSPEQVWSSVETWLATHALPERNATLDVYVDAGGVTHLIEMNGWYQGVGPALFAWKELLADPPPYEVRLVSKH